jgi:hypothetical protein
VTPLLSYQVRQSRRDIVGYNSGRVDDVYIDLYRGPNWIPTNYLNYLICGEKEAPQLAVTLSFQGHVSGW